MEYERGQHSLEALFLVDAANDDALNEADTRFQLIDRLLMDCLGWAPEQIATEEYQNGDYLDYVLGKPERLAVLEAKRQGKHFELPTGVEAETQVAIKTIYDYSEVNKKALDQVLRYCQGGGISVAVLCNGSQLIAFLGSRQDGISPIAGQCVLFANVGAIRARFAELWDALSPAGLRVGNLKRRLARRGRVTPPPERLSSRLPNYPGFRSRSELETDVRILADLFLQDIAHEQEVTDEFLSECYCSSGALSQYALVSKEILRTRYAALRIQVASTETVRSSEGPTPRLPGDLISAALTRRPLILLGDVGVGKTIFLKHFFRIEAGDALTGTTVFYVDFLRQSSLLEDVRGFLVDIVADALLAEHDIDIYEGTFIRAVYNREVNRFKKGLYAPLRDSDPAEYGKQELVMLSHHVENSLEHLRRSLEHLKGTRRYQFVLVLDNIDHHEEDFQEKLFVIGQSLAETWPAAVFMSLRPDTFYKSRKSGSVNAYQPRVFMVEPPRTDLVILRRLQFAKKQLDQNNRLDSFPEGLTINSESLRVYLDVLIEAFRGNESLKQLVDNLSSGNIRQALGFISNFVGSGYVSTARILEIYRKNGELYTLPLHEFIRAMLYQEYSYYDPNASTVVNMFDISTNTSQEHFALAILLAACEAGGEAQPNGFHEESSLYEHLQELGYSFEQVAWHISRALQRNLLEPNGAEPTLRSLRVTTAGSYMHKKMINLFTYVDAVLVDTPIIDPAIRQQIHDVSQIQDRLDRAGLFVDYLDAQWVLEDGQTIFSWPEASSALRRDIAATGQRAERRAALRASSPQS